MSEADRNDVTEYSHDDMPSTGMIVFHYESILCTTFDALPVTPPHYQTDNSILWDRFALPNTTRDSDHCWLRIYE